jgi:hypothetical protein
MMKNSNSLYKQLKDCYQTETNKEMFQHDFQFFEILMIYFH